MAKTSRIVGPDGQPIEMDLLDQEISAPSIAGIRQPWHASVATGLTPSRLAQILASAAEGDAHDYLTLAEEMEERDMHYASVLGTRKLALIGLTVTVESASDAAEDVKRADMVRELDLSDLIAHLVDGIGKGYAVSEIVWDRSGKPWVPRFAERDPRFFTFDRNTGTELRLLDEKDSAQGIVMPPYKFVVHKPRIRSGLPIRGGLARLAAPAYMCKAWTWRDWMAFADIYGMPMRIGTYGPNAKPADIARLMSAVSNLGSDAAAVMAESTKITFEAAANTAGAGEFFKTLAEFWDKQISKGILGQTMTADDGASKSQAVVHNEVRLDILEADAKALSKTLQSQVVKPFLDLNHGPSVSYPKITVVVPKPEDIKALIDALAKLVPLGLEVEQSVIRDKLGLPDPAKGAILLKIPAAAPTAPGPAANRARNAEGGGDPFPADLIAQRLGDETASASAQRLERIKAIVDGADNLEDLREQLLNAFGDLSREDLARAMQAGFAVAELVGRFDARSESGA